MKRIVILSIISLIIILSIPINGYAKLIILPPEKMIEAADVILTGKVVEIKKSDEILDNKIGIVKVISVIKGDLKTSTISLKETNYMNKGFKNKFPPVYRKVLLLLKFDSNGNLDYFTDGNHIGIIEGGNITNIYDGINLDRYPYIDKYNKFYQDNKTISVEKSLEEPLNKNAEILDKNFKNNNNTMKFSIILITTSLIFFTLKFIKNKFS